MPKSRLLALFLLAASLGSAPVYAVGLYTEQPPVELTGTHGKFDFIKVDESRGRLLACHTGNGSLDVIDEATSKLIKSIPTGNAQGVAIDDKGGRYFVSCSKPPQLVVIDATKLEVVGTTPLPGPADLCAYNGSDSAVYVDSDEKPEMWEIDPKSGSIIRTQSFAGSGMEDIYCGDNLLQNLKDTNELAWVQMVFAGAPNLRPTGKISTLPAEKPHGLAYVDADRVLIAGGNGKLVLLDYMADERKGKVIASAPIAPKVDEIAYDSGLKRVYCASGTGAISIVDVKDGKLYVSEPLPSASGCHSIAVDSKTHVVWIVYAKGDKPFVQSFTPGK